MLRKLSAFIAIGLIGVGLQACGVKPSAQDSCNFVQNSELQRVSWGSATPVVLYMDSTVPNTYYEPMKTAMAAWNKAIGREVLKLGGWINSSTDPRQDGVNVIYFRKTWESGRTNEQARTTVYWAGSRIYEADVRINAQDFEFFAGSQPSLGAVDMESLMIHEFGHVLGLSHTETPESVMVRSLAAASFRREVSSTDLNSIRCEY